MYFLHGRLRPRLDPLLDVGQVPDPLGQAAEVGQLLHLARVLQGEVVELDVGPGQAVAHQELAAPLDQPGILMFLTIPQDG